MKVFGIDISTWQRNYPYDKANAEGVKFAILRAGYSRTKDNQFETHYANAKRLGWGVGAYWYMYATTVEAAKAEAKAFLKAIAGKQFDYPVYLDIEDSTIRATGRDNCNAMVRAFGEIIEGAGYYFGVYCNLDWYRNVLSGAELNKKYDWWIASWSTGKPANVNYGLWQFGGETNYIRGNKVAGVVTDQNYAFKDYPSLIKGLGLNGYSKPSPEPSPEPTPTPTPTPEPTPEPTQKYSIGQEVVINGPLYVNANAASASGQVKNKTTKITRYVAGAKHPYNTSGDLGWMNESDIKPVDKSSKQYYTIVKGDTLYGIAIKFGTTINKLLELNPKITNANKIYAGDTIRVK